jgi:hypothetical protein
MPRRDDDESDDRTPRRRRRRDADAAGGGMPVGLLVGGGVAFLVAVVGLVAVLTTRGRPTDDPPPEVVRKDAGDPRPAPVDPPVPKPRPSDPKPAPTPADPPRPAGGVGTRMPPDCPPTRQVVFAGGPDGVVGLIGNALGQTDEVFTVAKTKTGELVGRVTVPFADAGHGYAVAPGGRYAAARGSAPFDGDPLVLYDVPSGKSYRFTPYPKKGAALTPDLVGFGFAGPDQLVTVHAASGFDVWQLPGMRRVAGAPGRPPNALPPIPPAGIGGSGLGHALSADGKTLAVFNGAGFSFHDTATGTARARTEALLAPGGLSMNFWGAAFNAAGTKLACLCTVHTPKSVTGLLVWDAATGQRLSFADAGTKTGFGLGWWGPNHVVVWEGGQGSAEALAVATGQPAGRVEVDIPGGSHVLAPATPGDELWFVYGGLGFEPGGAAPRLARVPPLAGRGSVLVLGPAGPRWR